MYVSPGIPANSGATFGVDLGDQLARDGAEVPKVVVKCAEAIEAYGALVVLLCGLRVRVLMKQVSIQSAFTGCRAPRRR